MHRRRKRGSAEINMTSLLDVLFCILFIVMLTNARNEADLRSAREKEAAEYARTAAAKNTEIARLREESETYRNLAESLELYKTEAVVAALRNTDKDGRHVLVLTSEDGTSTTLPLGSDNMENAISRLEGYIDALLSETAGRPLYLVFTCDRTKIYTGEFSALDGRLSRYQAEHKEIFYKITDPAALEQTAAAFS